MHVVLCKCVSRAFTVYAYEKKIHTFDGVGLKPASVSASRKEFVEASHSHRKWKKKRVIPVTDIERWICMQLIKLLVPIKHFTLEQHLFKVWPLSPIFLLGSMKGSLFCN